MIVKLNVFAVFTLCAYLSSLEIKAVPLISNTGFFYLHFVAKFSGVLNF